MAQATQAKAELTKAEAAAHLGVSVLTLLSLTDAGGWKVKREALDLYVKKL